jgi:hypothetical protein
MGVSPPSQKGALGRLSIAPIAKVGPVLSLGTAGMVSDLFTHAPFVDSASQMKHFGFGYAYDPLGESDFGREAGSASKAHG